MKKSIWIFLLAVLLPSIVLGWLALRSADEQQIILENRTAALYQKEAEIAAVAARSLIDDQRRAFNETVRQLLAKADPQTLANNFSTELARAWPRKAIGFSIGTTGTICAPLPQRAKSNPAWEKFLLGNGSFLAGTTPATVYWVSGDELAKPEQFRKMKTGQDLASNSQGSFNANFNSNGAVAESQKAAPLPKNAAVPQQSQEGAQAKQAQAASKALPPPNAQRDQAEDKSQAANPGAAAAPAPTATPVPEGKDTTVADARKQDQMEQAQKEAVLRNVAPQRLLEDNKQAAISQLTTTTTDFRALTTESNEGVVTRFVENQLNIIFWLRPAQAPNLLFGCLIEAGDLRDLWPEVLPISNGADNYDLSSRDRPAEFVLALLDDKARPVVTQPVGAKDRDWKHPFVASEIGEALPHWEAALYLQRPEQLRESAQLVRRTVLFLIAGALAVIACGGWLVVADARRQLALAQQKTDFVSNVSHELKTPLTSIRMFAELMQNGRGESTAKYPQYLRIIMVEAERLTRLINNVLDFARLERNQKQFDKKPLDLHAVVERAWEGHELHLQESGFATRWQAAPGPYPVVGDEDALAQILVNLLSNAEKYAGEKKEVELHSYVDGGYACVSVLDRGVGVPSGDERKIFESFYRAHDSLSSGIQGSGLGLTLAQQLAREHGGEILYQPRPGGGSNFTLRMPLAAAPKTV
ncbi:MAG: HAMP domain-containing sensor histidine kinase [Chthoniobacter sp.]|uniref:sensor histidine kinase n=1 Tax=Chthoniobacter sp. TaxID=2510640 RepID=UPI0032A52FB9